MPTFPFPIPLSFLRAPLLIAALLAAAACSPEEQQILTSFTPYDDPVHPTANHDQRQNELPLALAQTQPPESQHPELVRDKSHNRQARCKPQPAPKCRPVPCTPPTPPTPSTPPTSPTTVATQKQTATVSQTSQTSQHAQHAQTGTEAPEPDSDPRIDLNNASATELEKLPGVGPKTAEKIVAYRNRRPFRSPHDLRRIKGIGKKRMQRLESLVRVGASRAPN